MNTRTPGTAPAALSILLAAVMGLAGCKSVTRHLHWSHNGPPSPEVSTALTATSPQGAALAWPQIWQRNDVVVDLSGVGGTGSAVLMPRSGLAWPVRVALKVTPGAIGVIEVRGAQRWVVPVPAGGRPVTLELPPGVYVAATKQLTLNWGPVTAPAAP